MFTFTWDIPRGLCRLAEALGASTTATVRMAGPATGRRDRRLRPRPLRAARASPSPSRGCNNRCPYCIVPRPTRRRASCPSASTAGAPSPSSAQCSSAWTRPAASRCCRRHRRRDDPGRRTSRRRSSPTGWPTSCDTVHVRGGLAGMRHRRTYPHLPAATRRLSSSSSATSSMLRPGRLRPTTPRPTPTSDSRRYGRQLHALRPVLPRPRHRPPASSRPHWQRPGPPAGHARAHAATARHEPVHLHL